MDDRASLMIAATVADATRVKRSWRQFSSFHVMTPRTSGGCGFLVGRYVWTPEALELPASTRWDLRVSLATVIDEDSEEESFPDQVMAW